MNERIKLLALQAGSTHKQNLGVYQFYTDELEKFAKLIVGECADLCDRYQEIPATEPRHCANDIRSMFGVEEK